MTFDEITKKGVKEGMAHPAPSTLTFSTRSRRRELDRLVGYKLSPFLWKKVRRGLSAGRVQSVAVRLIRDREIEIENFKPDEYWNIDALLHRRAKGRVHQPAGGNGRRQKAYGHGQAAGRCRAGRAGRQGLHHYQNRKGQAPPSARAALHHLDFAAGREPRVRLFGHADDARRPDPVRGRGHCGARHGGSDHLHAYRLAAHRCRGAGRRQDLYRRPLGRGYVCKTPRKWKSRSATAAQDAHEAIRPSMPELTPDEVEQSISGDTAKLYRLIWSRFMASQMADCIQDTVSASITAGSIFSAHPASGVV